jgi:hypothetical protein
MGDLKPIGSEKLQGDEKIRRILELAYYNERSSSSKQTKNAELVKESSNGVYGIVREKDGYYVKKGLNEQALDYIGGLFMKNKNRFTSYAEALKRLELLSSRELNEEVTKYVLKPNKPKEEASMPQDAVDDMPPALPPADSTEPAPEMPADEPQMPEEEPAMAPEAGKRSDYMAEIQKFAGKLGQELRDQQPKMESDDIKYVLNMVISAVDLDKLEEDDIEEIGKKFERDETEEPVAGEEPAPSDEPSAEDEPTPTPEDELAERISKLEELVNSNFESPEEEEQDLGEYEVYFPDVDSAYEERTHLDYDPTDDYRIDNRPSKMYDDEDDEIELDITPELNDINESINTTLSKYFE